MTIMVSVDQFRARLLDYLDAVGRGQVVEITSHDRAIARIMAVDHQPAVDLAELIRRGEIDWSGGKPAGARVSLGDGPSMSDLIVADRG